MSEPKKRVKNQEPGARKLEASSPKSEFENPMLPFDKLRAGSAHHDKEDPETKGLPTENRPLQTEKMEVHHHPDLHHKEKPWKEYLLEYFMIFLAVMTGFFAESYREHRGDRSKEKEYAINIKKDLSTDTANINIWIPSLYKRVVNFDTLITCLEAHGPVKNGSDMYYLARLSTRNSIFEPSDNTILEMKSSGSLRLIQNREIVNGLMDFERYIGQYNNLFDIEGKENMLSYPLLGELFDATVFDKMVGVVNKGLTEREYAGGSTLNMVRPTGNPQLLSYDKQKINQLVFYLHQRKSSFMGEMRRLAAQKELAEKLIKMIDKEYNLEDE